MPSHALDKWRGDRIRRLVQIESCCTSNADEPAPAFLNELLQSAVMLLSGHFQGYCRDLYTECSSICADSVPDDLRFTIQAQFAASLALNTGNPTVENIRKDFERFGVKLDFESEIDMSRLTHLGHMNYWRNICAHQKPLPTHKDAPVELTMQTIQNWRVSCDGLAASLDDTMVNKLERIIGKKPW